MKNIKNQLILGIILIIIGSVLMMANILDYSFSWRQILPVVLMIIGILFFTSIKSKERSGAIFPGVIFFVTGLYLFLRNISSIDNFFYDIEIPTVVFIILCLAFLALYLTRPQDFGLLIPTLIFGILGTLYLLNDLWIIDREQIKRFWPLILIGIGIGSIVHGIVKKNRSAEIINN